MAEATCNGLHGESHTSAPDTCLGSLKVFLQVNKGGRLQPNGLFFRGGRVRRGVVPVLFDGVRDSLREVGAAERLG